MRKGNIFLSKSDYIKGIQCEKSLWFKYYEKHLKPEIDETMQAKFESGNEINDLARKYFPQGINAQEEYFDIQKSITSTKDLIKQNNQIIFEATAQIQSDKTHARIDILRKNHNGDGWDLIEVKGSTKIKPSHLNDLSFQYHIFSEAGYKIDSCLLMLINSDYVLDGELDINQLFKFEDVTQEILERQDKVKLEKQNLLAVLLNNKEPEVKIGAHCFEKDGHHPQCDFKNHCFKDVPAYSIFNICHRKNTAENIIDDLNSYDINDIDVSNYPKGIKELDIICYQENKTHLDKSQIKQWIDQLEYPLYFLDYETISSPIPIFNNSRPYQHIPFQFSLHIQAEEGGDLQHFEFLHKETSDPRESLIQNLIQLLKTKGSIIVYHESFEKSKNKELARDFPKYATDLEAINNRIIDLEIPFKKKYIYSPKQQSKTSIKKVLPAFTDLNYDNMEIANGGQAMDLYLEFIKGHKVRNEKLFEDLLDYCQLDTYAMVKLLQFLDINSQ